MHPRVAFVILNWNSRQMTAECIRSVLAMDSRGFEIVVVDNGSQDGSLDYLRREFPGIVLFPQERNLGFAAGCNVGMRYALAEGFEYVLIINNDTVVDAHFLSALLDEAQRVPDGAIISPKIYFYDLPDRFWWAGGAFSLSIGIAKHIGRKQVDAGQYDSPRAIDWATGCAALIRCDALRQVGLFDEILFGNGEDLDISLRLRRAGYKIWFAPNAKLWHKEGVDYRKNVGEYARKFTGTRNLLWIMHRYASTVQWLSFLPNFIFRYVLFYVLLSIHQRDYRSAKAVFEGILAFLRMRTHPGFAPLPPELTARNVRPVDSEALR
jgi:GT2 family glycosyltransferase